jgi:hypothetical protein
LEGPDDTSLTAEANGGAHDSECDTCEATKTWAGSPNEDPQRHQKIDASRSPDVVASAIWDVVFRGHSVECSQARR